MQRKVLVATVAAAPLMAIALAAQAETVVNTARTTPIATGSAGTSGAADDVKIDTAGSIKLTASGALVTLNSNNKVNNAGTLSTQGVNDSTAILINGGTTGTVTQTGTITLDEDYTPTDTDSDGDIDGAFALGQNRYGIRLTGPGAFTGDILATGGTITIEGNNSAGISLESALNGNLTSGGAIAVTGNNSYGVRVAAPVTGKVTVNGSVSVLGQNSTGVAIDSNVNGAFVIQGAVTATGYRYTARPVDKAVRDKLDADDLLQGGPAVRVAGSVTGGVLLDIRPADNDTTKTDEDGDGVEDAQEGNAALAVYGSAPALLIGSDTGAITLGVIGTGDNAYGLRARGAIVANGVYDGITSTGIQLGGNAGQSTTITNGARLETTLTSQAYEANANGVRVTAGANVPVIDNRGSITTYSVSEGLFDARGIVIEAGANVPSLRNGGVINSTVVGEKGSSYGVIDYSGGLTSIENTGAIIAAISPTDDASDTDDADTDASNETITGKAVAIDVSRNTTGVTLTQNGVVSTDKTLPDADGDGVPDNAEPSIIGQIRFGSGADTFNVLNGAVVGDISFGAGADTFRIDGGAAVIGAISDSDGLLDINIGKGSLGLTNAQAINISNLNLGAESKLVFTADPTAGANTSLVVSGAANIASGAQLGLRLNSLLTDETSYKVISAGSLTSGTFGQGLLDNAPYMYVASARAAGNDVYLDVRRRTAAEIGLARSGASAYDALFGSLSGDKDVASLFLGINDKSTFLHNYNQLLPDQGEGMFATLQNINQQISAATAIRPDPGDRYGPDSIWVQEINGLVRREDGETLGTDTQAFGFVAGYEAMGDAGGALGVTLAYTALEEHDTVAQVGEQTTASIVQAGVYWRRSVGPWRFNLGGGAGYGWFESNRVLFLDLNGDGATDEDRVTKADWGAVTANAFAGAAYEAKLGRFFTRPEARMDYTYLNESSHDEVGGGDVMDGAIGSRKWSNLSGDLGLVMGADFGREVWLRPEVRVGYRKTIAGSLADTVVTKKNGKYVLEAFDNRDGALTLGFALRAGTAMSYVALEGGAESTKRQKRYNVKLTGRTMF
ncbi:autotransporter domain-containing protein [Caulobacter flavus]|uniref:Autotransporter domain-containing protein n=1 Tax=Caulobacter flavus TaxID=1679497 RepID=A0A2N5D7B2_9CAUL|nr:autotransporter outer membrane beta-barrel domain-containing protein [Caulobacter flavus]AYV45538.1 autotransporter domain-containing protein [Caulobacter flavus]PLR21954.1 autotransporter domain-containing protein [Caulobacter flavus]